MRHYPRCVIIVGAEACSLSSILTNIRSPIVNSKKQIKSGIYLSGSAETHPIVHYSQLAVLDT